MLCSVNGFSGSGFAVSGSSVLNLYFVCGVSGSSQE